MLDQVNELFGIVPDHDLDIIQPRQSLTGIMTRTLEGLRQSSCSEHSPTPSIVQGDTTTSTAGAIAAFYRRSRSSTSRPGCARGNLYSPFPEEANRQTHHASSPPCTWPPPRRRESNLLRRGHRPGDDRGHRQHRHRRPADDRRQADPFRRPALQELGGRGPADPAGHHPPPGERGASHARSRARPRPDRRGRARTSLSCCRRTATRSCARRSCPLLEGIDERDRHRAARLRRVRAHAVASPTSSSPTPAASRRRRPASASRSWSCARTPSGPRRSTRARCS